jgi:hypothetical protein
VTTGESTGAAPGGVPGKKGMSGGAKVLIGCAIFVLLVGVAGAITVGVGVRFVGQKAQEFAGSAERHAEATETLQGLHARYPFQPPSDEAVRADRATAFLRATDQAWERARPAWEDLKRRSERAEERGHAGLGDLMAGVAGIHELTMALADALEAQNMSPAEYVWTGLALRQAYEALESGDTPAWIHAGNVELARRHQRQLAELTTDDERGGLVLGFAMMYGGLTGMEGWLRNLELDPGR